MSCLLISILIPTSWKEAENRFQQDGAEVHTARAFIQFLRQSTADFIQLEDWLSESPNLNVMVYCVWSLLLTETQNYRRDINSIDDLKTCLGRA